MKIKRILKIVMPILIIISMISIYTYKTSNSKVIDLKYPLHVNNINLEYLNSLEMPIILDFGSDSCIPCMKMEPIMERLNEKYQGKAIIQFADMNKYDGIEGGFPVQVMPTQFFINKNGTPYIPSEEIKEQIEGFLLFEDEGKVVYSAHLGELTEKDFELILEEMGANNDK